MRAAYVLGIAFALGAPAHAADVPSHLVMRDVPVQTGSVQLASGTRIYVEQERSRPLAAVIVVVDAGAAADPKGQEGLAHLVEHLAFRARSDGRHPYTDTLELVGAGAWNAFTSMDLTVYYAQSSTEVRPARG